MHKFDWHSIPDDADDGSYEVLPSSYAGRKWLWEKWVSGQGQAYWATESSYDFNSPVYVDENVTPWPEWAVHIVWFSK